MRLVAVVFSAVLGLVPSLASAWEVTTLHAGITVTLSKAHGTAVGVEVGADHAFGFEDLSPVVGAAARVMIDRKGPILPQLVARAGGGFVPEAPGVVAQAEVGAALLGGRVTPLAGAVVWSAPMAGGSVYGGLSVFSLLTSAEPVAPVVTLTAGGAANLVTYVYFLPSPSPSPSPSTDPAPTGEPSLR